MSGKYGDAWSYLVEMDTSGGGGTLNFIRRTPFYRGGNDSEDRSHATKLNRLLEKRGWKTTEGDSTITYRFKDKEDKEYALEFIKQWKELYDELTGGDQIKSIELTAEQFLSGIGEIAKYIILDRNKAGLLNKTGSPRVLAEMPSNIPEPVFLKTDEYLTFFEKPDDGQMIVGKKGVQTPFGKRLYVGLKEIELTGRASDAALMSEVGFLGLIHGENGTSILTPLGIKAINDLETLKLMAGTQQEINALKERVPV